MFQISLLIRIVYFSIRTPYYSIKSAYCKNIIEYFWIRRIFSQHSRCILQEYQRILLNTSHFPALFSLHIAGISNDIFDMSHFPAVFALHIAGISKNTLDHCNTRCIHLMFEIEFYLRIHIWKYVWASCSLYNLQSDYMLWNFIEYIFQIKWPKQQLSLSLT